MVLQVNEWHPTSKWTIELYVDDKWIAEMDMKEFMEKYGKYYVNYMTETKSGYMAIYITKKKVEYGS